MRCSPPVMGTAPVVASEPGPVAHVDPLPPPLKNYRDKVHELLGSDRNERQMEQRETTWASPRHYRQWMCSSLTVKA